MVRRTSSFFFFFDREERHFFAWVERAPKCNSRASRSCALGVDSATNLASPNRSVKALLDPYLWLGKAQNSLVGSRQGPNSSEAHPFLRQLFSVERPFGQYFECRAR